MSFLLVGLGAGLGALCRYLVTQIISFVYKGIFPLATFIVNMIGSYAMAAYLLQKPDETQLLLIVIGFFGGLTTFSTFSLESFKLLKQKELYTFIYYISMSYVVGVLLATIVHVL